MASRKPREEKASNNPDGNNQWGKKDYPDDEVLSLSLHEYQRRQYPLERRLQALVKDHGLVIGKTKLKALNKKFMVPSVRKRLQPEEEEALVAEQLAQDTTMSNGYRAVTDMLRIDGVAIPRDRVRTIMLSICPEGFDKRFPGSRRIVRVPLTAIGPFHEVCGDGHLKLNGQALNMGPVSIPIYGMKDKWSDYVPLLVTAPNVQTEAAIAHLYLDFVAAEGAIPIQFTTDCGSETGWIYAYQYTIREQVAPDIDMGEFPPHKFLKSTHNTVIEGFWSWLRKKRGFKMKDAIIRGREEGRFFPNNTVHIEVFNFIFPPLIQNELDNFRKYWNYHHVRSQRGKQMAQNHIPIDAFQNPKDYGAMDCRIPVPKEMVMELRAKLETEVGSRELHLEFLSMEERLRIGNIYAAIGSPPLDFDNAWEVFTEMVNYELDIVE